MPTMRVLEHSKVLFLKEKINVFFRRSNAHLPPVVNIHLIHTIAPEREDCKVIQFKTPAKKRIPRPQ
jgi:hypothetical protein